MVCKFYFLVEYIRLYRRSGCPLPDNEIEIYNSDRRVLYPYNTMNMNDEVIRFYIDALKCWCCLGTTPYENLDLHEKLVLFYGLY